MRTVIQVPVSPALRKKAQIAAKDLGFSSVQEVVRVMLTGFVKGTLNINFGEQFPSIQLSEKAIRKYEKMDRDFESGKNTKSFDNVEDLMKDLTS